MGPTPTEGPLTLDELQLAARNKGMPLEALRYDVTPSGLHYLLVHFDIPAIDPAEWRLEVGGNVERRLELRLEDLHSRPRRTIPVTLECAGNGRARLTPRPISQPWLNEAVGTAEWTGTPLAGVLEDRRKSGRTTISREEQKEIAKQTKTSTKTVGRINKLLKEKPEVAKQVAEGKKSLRSAVEKTVGPSASSSPRTDLMEMRVLSREIYDLAPMGPIKEKAKRLCLLLTSVRVGPARKEAK